MTAAWVILAGVLGAAVGSFLNVVVHRVPAEESIVSPGSKCPGCSTPLAPYDNVPVVSWLVLQGRCRHCGRSISARYPLIELFTAAIFAVIVLVRGADSALAAELVFAAALIALAVIDFEHRILPNSIIFPAAIWAVAVAVVIDLEHVPELLIAGAAAFLGMLLVALAKPGGMGLGDVKLAGMMGLYLGLDVLPGLFVGFLTGSLVGVAIMARSGVAARKDKVPFGPFLALGGLVALLAGNDLIRLYGDRFL